MDRSLNVQGPRRIDLIAAASEKRSRSAWLSVNCKIRITLKKGGTELSPLQAACHDYGRRPYL
jgi:hypothetical protein